MKRKYLKWNLIIFGAAAFFFLGILIWVYIFPRSAIRYLYVNSPVEPDVMIVEGWISDHALEEAVNIFRKRDYSHLLTSGGPLEPHVTLFVNGFMEFEVSKADMQKADSLKFWLSGTPSGGEWPHYRIFVGETQVDQGTVVEDWKDYGVSLLSHLKDNCRIRVVFDNDAHSPGEDRNLSIESLTLGGRVIPARSQGASIWMGSPEAPLYFARADIFTHAEQCFDRLLKAGVDPDSISVVSAPATGRNRTFTSALAVAKWIDEEDRSAHFFNVYTEGIHARRTWLLYKYALRRRSGAVGVMSSSNMEHLSRNPEMFRAMMLREAVGNIYYRIFFNKRKLERQFLYD